MRHHWVRSFCRVTTFDYTVHNLSTAAPETEGIFNYWELIFILYPDGHIYMEMSFASILLLASLTNKSSQTLKHSRCWKLNRVVANGHVLRSQLTGILITEFWLAPIEKGLSSARSGLSTCPLVRRKSRQRVGGWGFIEKIILVGRPWGKKNASWCSWLFYRWFGSHLWYVSFLLVQVQHFFQSSRLYFRKHKELAGDFFPPFFLNRQLVS